MFTYQSFSFVVSHAFLARVIVLNVSGVFHSNFKSVNFVVLSLSPDFTYCVAQTYAISITKNLIYPTSVIETIFLVLVSNEGIFVCVTTKQMP